MKVIAVCGTNGAGKNTLVEMLVDKYGFEHVRVRDLLVMKAKEAHVEIGNRTDMNRFSEGYYEKGKSFVGEFIQQNEENKNVFVIESIRRACEVKDIRKFCPESILIGVDADPKVRFERVISRNSITDHVDFEQFKHEEEKESNGEKDTQMNLPKVMSMADIVVDNSKTLGEFEEEVRKKVFEHPFFVRLA